jgi:predicted DNA-binding transcriptional regulator YafY
MPASKNAMKRYLIINRCLTSKGKKYWSTEEILRILEENDIFISARTLRYDIEAMRFDTILGFNAPIEYCKINKGYYYSKPLYSVNTVKLTEEQLYALNLLVEVLQVKVQDSKLER